MTDRNKHANKQERVQSKVLREEEEKEDELDPG